MAESNNFPAVCAADSWRLLARHGPPPERSAALRLAHLFGMIHLCSTRLPSVIHALTAPAVRKHEHHVVDPASTARFHSSTTESDPVRQNSRGESPILRRASRDRERRTYTALLTTRAQVVKMRRENPSFMSIRSRNSTAPRGSGPDAAMPSPAYSKCQPYRHRSEVSTPLSNRQLCRPS